MIKTATDTIVRTIVLVIAIVNLICNFFGWVPIDVDESTLYDISTLVLAVGSSIWAWWKNNDFSQEAKQAGIVLKELKEEKKKEA